MDFYKVKKRYKKLISYAINVYGFSSNREMRHLADIGVWKAIRKFNGTTRFASFLFKHIKWEILNEKRLGEKFLTNVDLEDLPSKKNIEVFKVDIMDPLNSSEKKLFDQKYIRNMTLSEISPKVTTIFKRLEKIKHKIRKDMT
jgi:DNA-directed RNA polymerase specialized sigma subunit